MDIINKLDNPSEGYFGLAKIYCYEGRLAQAIQQLKLANSAEPNDISAKIWMIVLRTLTMNTKKKALKTVKMCYSIK